MLRFLNSYNVIIMNKNNSFIKPEIEVTKQVTAFGDSNLKRLLSTTKIQSSLSNPESPIVPDEKTNVLLDQKKSISKNLDDQSSSASMLINSPFFPSSVYDALPPILQEICSKFENKREKDIILVSCLTVISSILPNYSGIYDRRTVYPNLYSYVLAGPASGKSAMIFAKLLAISIHQYLVQNSQSEIAQFNELMQETKKNKNKNKKQEGVSYGFTATSFFIEKPTFKCLFMPGNISSTRLLLLLRDSEDSGLIFETESQTILIAGSNEWGQYIDLLLKAFHHEPVSIARVKENLYFEIEKPCLSICLSGVPHQLGSLIKTEADGLMSRFMFYIFDGITEWKNVTDDNIDHKLEDYFLEKSKDFLDFYKQCKNNSRKFKLSETQSKKFNQFFEEKLNLYLNIHSHNVKSTLIRTGIIAFRILMILTAMRNFNNINKSNSDDYVCSDQDFKTGLEIVSILIDHSMIVTSFLPKKNLASKGLTKFQTFIEKLPQGIFTTQDALEIGKSCEYSERSVFNVLKLENYIKKLETGKYQKVQ